MYMPFIVADIHQLRCRLASSVTGRFEMPTVDIISNKNLWKLKVTDGGEHFKSTCNTLRGLFFNYCCVVLLTSLTPGAYDRELLECAPRRVVNIVTQPPVG